jgi:CheY-like chemotaxis protein
MRQVIVADDVAEICNLVAIYLEPFGFAVTSAKSGREALEIYRNKGCDLVVADVLMPEVDGIELISELKREPNVRVVAISGGGQNIDASYCLNLAKATGAHVTLPKPFNRKQLLAAVETALAS